MTKYNYWRERMEGDKRRQELDSDYAVRFVINQSRTVCNIHLSMRIKRSVIQIKNIHLVLHPLIQPSIQPSIHSSVHSSIHSSIHLPPILQRVLASIAHKGIFCNPWCRSCVQLSKSPSKEVNDWMPHNHVILTKTALTTWNFHVTKSFVEEYYRRKIEGSEK